MPNLKKTHREIQCMAQRVAIQPNLYFPCSLRALKRKGRKYWTIKERRGEIMSTIEFTSPRTFVRAATFARRRSTREDLSAGPRDTSSPANVKLNQIHPDNYYLLAESRDGHVVRTCSPRKRPSGSSSTIRVAATLCELGSGV